MDMYFSPQLPTVSTPPLAFRPSTTPPNKLPALCYQSLPTIKFCNSSVLITIRIAGDGGTPLLPPFFRIFFQVSFALSPVFATDPRNRQLTPLFATHPKRPPASPLLATLATPPPPTALPPRPFLFGGFTHTSSCFLRPGPANLTNRQPIWAATGLKKKRPWETFAKEFLHGFNGLEGTSHLRFNFDPGALDHRGAHRAHQLQPAPQGMPHARQATTVLPDAQPHHRAFRSRQGLRVRKRSVRALRRKGA